MNMRVEDAILKSQDPIFGQEENGSSMISSFYQKREIMKLPPSAKFIIHLLKMKGVMNRKQIIKETMMPDRTVGFALKKLLEKNLIQKVDSNFLKGPITQRKRRHPRQDRRITNYLLVSTLLPYEMIEA